MEENNQTQTATQPAPKPQSPPSFLRVYEDRTVMDITNPESEITRVMVNKKGDTYITDKDGNCVCISHKKRMLFMKKGEHFEKLWNW
jgi:hypothetical protein